MNIKKRILLFILLIIVPLFSIWILQQKFITLEGQTMGTAYSIKCYVPKWISKQQLSLDVKNELDRLNLIFSTFVIITKSPASICGVKVFLCLPRSTFDIYAANLPTIAFSALICIQLFLISFFFIKLVILICA